MTPATRTWLLCALLLRCAALPHRGRCAGKSCVAFFQERADFDGAQEGCRSREGTLLDIAELPDFGASGGTFWIGEPAAGGAKPRRCRSVSAASGGNVTFAARQCGERLDGFLCHFGLSEECGALALAGDAHINYTSRFFEVDASAAFPPGTKAVARQPAARHSDSKHLCFGGRWLRAPWGCEVYDGGCEGVCLNKDGPCACAEGHSLHPNNYTCVKGPCADCQVGEECVNVEGKFKCQCRDGFVLENNECMDVSVCNKCEHDCEKVDEEYRCVCRTGFRAAKRDPNKCDVVCDKQDCLARCVPDAEREKKGNQQCFCPDGYIKDLRGNITYCTDIDECENQKPCDHECKNYFGGFECLCRQGFRARGRYACKAMGKPKPEGSGEAAAAPTPAPVHPATVPSYVRTGSILGITVFLLLCLVLLVFLVRDASKRCTKTGLHTLDMDIFSPQQVTTEAYKRLSSDRGSRAAEGQT